MKVTVSCDNEVSNAARMKHVDVFVLSVILRRVHLSWEEVVCVFAIEAVREQPKACKHRGR